MPHTTETNNGRHAQGRQKCDATLKKERQKTDATRKRDKSLMPHARDKTLTPSANPPTQANGVCDTIPTHILRLTMIPIMRATQNQQTDAGHQRCVTQRPTPGVCDCVHDGCVCKRCRVQTAACECLGACVCKRICVALKHTICEMK